MPDPAVPDVVLRRVEVGGRLADVLVSAGSVVTLDAGNVVLRPDTMVIDGRGGALLPGLHDHHLHLLATAAAERSVRCGPLHDRAELAAAFQAAAGDWVRAVDYHDRIAGPLDRRLLDELVPDRPVRVQDRGGALWVLNSRALALVDTVLDDSEDVERDRTGRPTGRLWRYDARLRPALPASETDLADLGRALLGYGITGITDATPDIDASGLDLFARARASGDLPQHITVLGAPDDLALPRGIARGPRKLHLRDHDLPELPELTASIAASHARGRAVAVHCVSAESLVMAVAALDAAGVLPGDRVEHASVVLPGFAQELARLGVAVVTQPVFLRARGDDYLRDVEPFEQGCLYPYRSLLDAGVPVAAASDAPHGALDPWLSIAAAGDRRTVGGVVIGPDERVPRAAALAGYLSPGDDPGGPPRRVEIGAPADFCLLRGPLAQALDKAPANPVRLTISGGRVFDGG